MQSSILSRLQAEVETPTLTRPGAGCTRAEVAARLAHLEAAVAADPAGCLPVDLRGDATLEVGVERWSAGHFEVPSLDALAGRIPAPGPGAVAPRLFVLLGRGPLTDVGALQALLGPGVLYQVASQFNCLEAPGDHMVPVARYPSDPTQGPRASVSAFPGTFLRHYRAPSPGGPFVQRDDRSLDLLAEALPPGVAAVRAGYLRPEGVHDAEALAAALGSRSGRIRVGLHAGVEVALGHDWGGPVPHPAPRIHQVFTSTIALGGYGRAQGLGPSAEAIERRLLGAAYLGTLLAARALGASTVVLTMIGGGVFGNSHSRIWEALLAALDQPLVATGAPLEVWLNARDTPLPLAQLEQGAGARGGRVVRVRGRQLETLR